MDIIGLLIQIQEACVVEMQTRVRMTVRLDVDRLPDRVFLRHLATTSAAANCALCYSGEGRLVGPGVAVTREPMAL